MQEPSLTQKQKDLASQLSRYKPGIRSSYLGAIYAIRSEEYPDRLVHYSHSLRQVIDLLARCKQTGRELGQPLSRMERKRLLQSVIDSLGRQGYAFDADYETLVDEHANLSRIAHGRCMITEEQALGKLSAVEDILYRLTRQQTAVYDEIDEIVLQDPSTENAKKLKELQFRWATQSRIIEKLPQEWLPSLIDAGFFDDPRPATPSTDSLRCPWMPSIYLTKCTKKFPKEALQIILSCKFKAEQERNPAVYADFLTCALDLPIPDLEKIVQKALTERWHDFIENYWLAEKYVEIIERLYLDGEYDLAIRLARPVFTPVLSEARSENDLDGKTTEYRAVTTPFDFYWFEQTLQNTMTKLVQKNPVPITRLLVDLLEETIRLANEGRGSDDQHEDGLSARRPFIEESDQNRFPDIKSIFEPHLRDCLLYIGNKHEEKLREAMRLLEPKKYWIYRRMELYVYTEFPGMFRHEINDSLVRYFGEPQVHHEYYNLIKSTFQDIPDEIRQKIFGLIDAGFDDETFTVIANKLGEAQAKRDERYWRLCYLEAIKDNLDEARQRMYDELVGEFGMPEHPNYLSYHTVTVGEPPIDPAIFGGKTVDEVFGIVKEHVPEGFSFEDKTIATFGEYVESNAAECSKRSLELKDTENGAQYELLSGLEKSLEKNTPIEWDSVLSLIEHVISPVHENRRYAPKSHDPTSEICSLVEEGLKKDSVGFGFRGRLWAILKMLADIGALHQDEETWMKRHGIDLKMLADTGALHQESKYPNNDRDPLTMSINNVGGQSFHAVYQYAAWCERNGTKKRFLEPGVKQVFNDYLDGKSGEHTISRHAVLGAFLPIFYYLDEGWAKELPEKITSSRNTKIAFWEGYVNWNRLYTYVFADLSSWYGEFLNGNLAKGMKRKQTYKSTINHSLLAYFYDMGSSDAWFEKFLENADDDVIGHCVFQVGVIIKDKKGDSRFNKEKLAKLWQHPSISQHSLGRWFRDSPLDMEATISLYLNHLEKYPKKINPSYTSIKDLRPYLKDFPLQVADCIGMLVDKREHNHMPEDEMKPMIRDLLEKNTLKSLQNANQ